MTYPTEISESAEEATERKDSVEEEDTTLDPMREAVKNAITGLRKISPSATTPDFKY